MSTKPESMPPPAPGPWAINGRFIGPADSIFNDLDNAVCMTPDRSVGSRYETPTRQDTANARLIAAAPEMLAALGELLEVLDTDALDARTEEIWKQAHDAVDKALGNEPLSVRMEKANARYNALVATGGTEQEIDAAYKVMNTVWNAARLAELKKNRVAPLLPATPPSKKTR